MTARRSLSRKSLANLGRQLGSVSGRYRLCDAWQSAKGRKPFAYGSRRSPPPAPLAPTARDPTLARLEAVLFLARSPLSTRKLAAMAGLADGTQARTLIRRLNRLYDEAGRTFRAEEVAGGFQLLTRPQFGSWLRRFYTKPNDMRLSAPALETLAVVAYRGPVPRADIEAIRGVDCGEMLRQLIDRHLVRIAGRSDDLGRPYFYGTTKRFLEAFGLRHLDDLPRAELLRTPNSASEPARVAGPVEEASAVARPIRPGKPTASHEIHRDEDEED